MKKTESGFSLIEMLVVLVVVGILFYFLVLFLDPNSIILRVKNSVVRSSLSKITLSVESFRSSYDRLPNEQDFFSSLKPGTEQMGNSCDLMGLADYDCRFIPNGTSLPMICDSSGWRSDGSSADQCYMRYLADPDSSFYRLYAQTWDNSGFLVFEGGKGLFSCPAEFDDFTPVESCQKI